ncbi:MAG: bifunctional nuclease family protein [Bacteroidales bacterium]|nr:bifunctional nuclease family protein [Bacteroidales bacterium]
MNKIRLKIIGMSYSQSQSGAFVLILVESNGRRRLPIIIGGSEAQAIAMELEKMKPTRPLTHDLFKNFADHFNIKLKEVIINKFHEGVFYALLKCERDGEEIEIDSRTSDAVALSLRFHCPIYTYESILKAAGMTMDGEKGKEKQEYSDDISVSEYSELTVNELTELLNKAVENEEYEKASQIRDEINRRKKKK